MISMVESTVMGYELCDPSLYDLGGREETTMAKNDVKTYFTIGRGAKTGVFVDRKSPSSNTRVMSSKVFEKAVKQADGKFREVTDHRGERPRDVRK